MEYIKISLRKEQGTLQGGLSEALEEMFGVTMPTRFAVGEHAWRPNTDVYETPEEMLVIIDLAGVKVEDVHLEVGRRLVRIFGKREQKSLQGTTKYRLAEIAYGYFERQIALPVPVDEDKVEATYRDGFLEVRMKKRLPEGDGVTKVTVRK
ncbi:MAG TPA: Hsp20/alpha crystallin family protein [Syntrophales bacterium]|nr:Hsp20/alpha crystallin family protein [Syntrophales bacterium]HOL59284.1 Hsp20/alpha crystallin family protein [Syntrophales bacterium]HPO35334.1 Hsp20/alpha crystallin family protein [Syntrophales bacterium]